MIKHYNHLMRLKAILEKIVKANCDEKEVVDACYIYAIENGLQVEITKNEEGLFEIQINLGEEE